MRKISKSLLAVSVATAISMPAMATNGILPLGNGMVAHGFGGAGIANAAETMSSVDNPALMSNASNQWAVGASLFNPNRSSDLAGAGYVESDSNYFIIPQAGYATSINDKMDFGVLAYAMGGMNSDFSSDLLAPVNAATGGFVPAVPMGMDLMGLVVAPTISFKTSDKTSIGASLLLGYARLETKGPGIYNLGGGLVLGTPADASDSATGWGVKLGVVSEVSPGTSVGFTYQSEISMSEMDTFCAPFTANGDAGIFSGASDCALNMPSQMGLGVSHQVNSKWKVVADVLQVNWTDVAIFDELFGWEDQTIFKIGAEMKMSNDLAIRFGFNHGASPIPDEAVPTNVLAPAVTEDHFTIGFTSKSSGSEYTGYFAYVPENEQSGANPFGGTSKVKMDQFAIGVGYNAKF